MSIIYPRHAFATGDVMDADHTSATLQDFASEVDGNLGEQNWDEGGFTSRTDDLETDAVLRLYHYKVAVNWTTLNAGGEPAAGPTGALRVPMVLAWSPLLTATLTTCRGGTYRIVASFQLDAGSTSTAATYWDELGGCAFTFRIDGVIYEEAADGGGERSNDPKGEALYEPVGPVIVTISAPLSAGNHIIELMARPARVTTDTTSFSSTSFYEVFNHEFYIVEAR